MAYAPAVHNFARPVQRLFDSIVTTIGNGFDAYIEACSRRDEIEALSACTDEELARMGITRDQIVHYVFRDRFGG